MNGNAILGLDLIDKRKVTIVQRQFWFYFLADDFRYPSKVLFALPIARQIKIVRE